MLCARKLVVKLFIGAVALTLAFSGLALTDDNELRKELEEIYAKREKAIRDKNFAYLKFHLADDYTEKGQDGTIQNRQQADEEADRLYPMFEEVHEYSLKIDSIKAGENNEIIVETSDNGEFSFSGPDGRLHKLKGKGRQRDSWIRTQQGLKIKFHETLESVVEVDGKLIN
ncbi:MAG: hypothetical protein AB1631_05090 [Acidobacteriota bacterium]